MKTVVASALLVWAGLLLGVSFIATPAKFSAQSLTFASALDVGRVTFTLFNKIEWVVFIVIAFFSLFSSLPLLFRISCAFLFAMLSIQTFFLLPELSARAASIIAGEAVPATSLHAQYVLIEVVKLFLVGFWGVYLKAWQ